MENRRHFVFNDRTLMKISVLASGSKGNCTLVSSGKSNILVDVGISTQRICKSLSKIGIRPESLSAVLVTHAHSDHFQFLNTFLKRYPVPVYASEETASSIDLFFRDYFNKYAFSIDWTFFNPGSSFALDDLLITPFEVPHDANGAVAFTIESENQKIGIATDLGCTTNSILYHLSGCDAMVLEMNHDRRMLMDSDRPPMLKSRIAGKLGHLSNDQAIEFLESLDTSRLKYLFPAHLSDECNDFSCVKAAILSMGKKRCFNVVATSQNEMTELVDLAVNNLKAT